MPLVDFLSGMTGMITSILNEFFSWNIMGLNVGAMVVIIFVIWLVVKIIWG